MSLPEMTEEPHHDYGSFRVRGRIFVTVPPDRKRVHVFVSEQHRDPALAIYAAFTEKLLWGGKVVGVRVTLADAEPSAVKRLVRQAWQAKAPQALHSALPKPGEQPFMYIRAWPWPNPSLHLTFASRLRRLAPAGELKR